MKIGFQGDIFSNSEEAASQFVHKLELTNSIFIPLITSYNVVQALIKKDIDYGVMALKNIVAGEVIETKKALSNDIRCIDTLNLPIHHCLFKKNSHSQIEYIASHPQALAQTKKTRNKIFPNMPEIFVEDTALAAKNLSLGIYPENYAVICKENAGMFYKLHLVEKNIEDNSTNTTTFGLFELNTFEK